MTVHEDTTPEEAVIDLIPIIEKLFEEHPDKVGAARLDPWLQGWFTGRVMKATEGKIDSVVVSKAVASAFK
jgi:Asp-tRNA(Asn)/Glu-tRNA(Gln) amidotransferase B subunit